jgi:hypothetical protein
MLVYQSLLLIGYLYAHGISRLSAEKQAVTHMVLMLACVAVVFLRSPYSTAPILPGPEWKPLNDADPICSITLILATSVGLPFLFLSSTSSLLQRWFSMLFPAETPYRFYTISNAGSLMALLSYPVVVEPLLNIRTQAILWSIGFALLAVPYTLLAVLLYKSGAIPNITPRPTEQLSSGREFPRTRHILLWFFLSMCSSTMLLATTNQITQDVAPIPFLWILPLSIYLVSFIICFRQDARPSGDFWIPVLLLFSILSWYAISTATDLHFLFQLLIFSGLLFACCMLSHGELVRLKPHPQYLTVFYLMVALGGAAGGVIVGIIAPLCLRAIWELHFTLIVYCLFSISILMTLRQQWMRIWWLPLISVALLVIVLLVRNIAYDYGGGTIARSRNFYGALSVHERRLMHGRAHTLFHGGIQHGMQYQTGPFRSRPTDYFGESSGVGMALRYHLKRLARQPIRVGGIGLGVGTISTYGRTNDYFRFYEINPDVVKIASDRRYFSYLSDLHAKLDIIVGDARISLEHERDRHMPQNFDILVIDAFNSDSIPMHLLTKEAFELYLYHLAPDAVIAVHVSNAFLNLVPVVLAAGEHFKLNSAVLDTRGDKWVSEPATWVLLTRSRLFLELPAISAAKTKPDSLPAKRILWTDDHSNLFSIMNRIRW